jgi:hypothetical protein
LPLPAVRITTIFRQLKIFRYSPKKKEIRATASLGGGDEINTFDLQAAYAITNRFAVMSNFMHGNGGSSSDGGKRQLY